RQLVLSDELRLPVAQGSRQWQRGQKLRMSALLQFTHGRIEHFLALTGSRSARRTGAVEIGRAPEPVTNAGDGFAVTVEDIAEQVAHRLALSVVGILAVTP